MNTVSSVTQNANCVLPELTMYTATFTTNEVFAKQEKKDVETKAATGHHYGDVSYTWTADNSKCTAERSCTCGDKQTETVNAVSSVTQNASCVLPELTTYTVTFTTNEAFAKQEKKNVETNASLGHDFAIKYTIDKNATCTENGSESRHCSRCSVTTDSRLIIAKGHTYIDKVVPPTCATEGYTTHVCSVCGASSTDTKLPATSNHTDSNSDGKCDTCGKDLGTHKPSDLSKNCSCMCHKSGFQGFIYKIVRIFWKLFKINKTCACGVDHY